MANSAPAPHLADCITHHLRRSATGPDSTASQTQPTCIRPLQDLVLDHRLSHSNVASKETAGAGGEAAPKTKEASAETEATSKKGAAGR